MDVAEVRKQVFAREWFHRIDLGDGVVTPGIDDSPRKLEGLRIPADLTGKTVLDIGAYDGFFSFAAERRGAARVLATDKVCWNLYGMATKDGFDLAKRALGSRVEEMEIADKAPGAEALMVVAGEDGRLHNCLSELDDRTETVIRTAFFEGVTYDALARRMDTPLGTVKSWVRRGLAKLKGCLEQ